MEKLKDRLLKADSTLAKYAVPHSGGFGKVHEEEGDETRFRFQRDRGRIVHIQSFRRLKGKTQVFIGGDDDHYRTRLTHTMEVTGISRDIARTLSLNEDLAECVALAHDLGHPPFGHAGEEALDEWMKEHGSMFEHNLQSHRIVTLLEKHSSLYEGLNLNQEILDGLLKHITPYDSPAGEKGARAPSLESQVVNIADEITYTAHDCEDGLRAKLFSLDELKGIPVITASLRHTDARGTSLRGAVIDILVNDLYKATNKELVSQRIKTLDDVYNAKKPVVIFSNDVMKMLSQLRAFLWDNMYNHLTVLERAKAGQEVVLKLCNHYKKNPDEKIKSLVKKTGGTLEESIKDYVSGMTDRFATNASAAL